MTLALLALSLIANSQTTISFLHYNDLHAHMISHKDLIREGETCGTDNSATTIIGYRGGLSRIKTLVDSLKATNPNNVAMNIGDTYHGGVEAAYTVGNAIIDPVNAIGFDIGVPGNWDYGYGPGVFRKRYTPNGPFPTILNQMLPSFSIKSPNFTYLAANLTYKKLGPMDSSPDGGAVLPGTAIKNIGGVNVGFIGITSDIVPQMYAALSIGFNFLKGETNYVNLINSLSASLRNNGAKIVVVMSELGIHKDYQLAQKINSGAVNVFFSAHTHELTMNPLSSISGAVVVEAGDDAYLGKMDLTVEPTGEVKISSWKIFPITEGTSENSTVKALVDKERAPFLVSDPNLSDPMGTSSQTLHRPITDIVGHSDITLTRKNSLESNINDAFTDILRKYSKTQTAITPGFRFDSPTGEPGSMQEGNVVATGDITLEDVYRFFPVFYTIATANIRADSLSKMVEKSLNNVYATNAFDQGGGWVEGFSGLNMDINLNNTYGSRIQSMKLEGSTTELNKNDTLSVTGCQRPNEAADILCSYTGFFNKADFINSSTSAAWTPQQILENYLITDTIKSPNRKTFNDVSGIPVYPYSPWVQPLPSTASCYVINSVNDVKSADATILLYPNPVSQELRISTTLEPVNIQIFNSLGENVIQIQGIKNQGVIPLSKLGKGAYLVNVVYNYKVIASKLVIKE
jgi:2',3'-cyclic-nucleotide 2'-phosphodiesterase (5'-nucleotidase family)